LAHFPSLDGFGPTRRTLQLYSRALSALARAHAPTHPNWWHVSLRPTPSGLVTTNIPLPDGNILAGRIDLRRRALGLSTSDGRAWVWPVDAGLSGSAMGERIIAAAAEAGLADTVDRSKFADDEPGVYEAEVVARFLAALIRAERVLGRRSAELGIHAGPAQLWPHGFDMSMEWFGSRLVRSEDGGEEGEQPAQLNLGFYPGEDDAGSYFYSSPWPFDADKLLGRTLPAGATWHTDGWQGAKLAYTAVRDEEKLYDFATAVFEIAAPLLTR
jgi:hypothetical protein